MTWLTCYLCHSNLWVQDIGPYAEAYDWCVRTLPFVKRVPPKSK